MGFIDLHGGSERRFGSIGVALERPRLVLEVRSASDWRVEGVERERAAAFAERFYAHYDAALPDDAGRVYLHVIEAIPAHVGLGSGTQLALAVGTALARLHGIDASVFELAEVMGRGERSSIGIGAFERGGFLVDGGHATEGPDHIAPIVVHHPFPSDWRFVIVTPHIAPGLSGDEEDAAFVDLSPSSLDHTGRISRLLVLKMLPALVERDIAAFGEALTEIQQLVGDSFAPVQGGRYADEVSARLIDHLLSHGALGAGQSSWGPTVYGLVRGEQAALALEERLRRFPEGQPMSIYHSRVACEGARIVVSS